MSVTLIIVIITCIVSLPLLNNEEAKEKFLFWPYMINTRNQYQRFLSGALVHADMVHLAFNMITLYSFGQGIEEFYFPSLFGEQYATILYIMLYILGIVFASIPDYVKYKDVYGYRALGASGAVSAVVFAVILLAPTQKLYVFMALPVPAYIFGLLYLGFSAYMAKKGHDNIGHSAHFWGGVFGLVFTFLATKAFTDVDVIQRFIQAVF